MSCLSVRFAQGRTSSPRVFTAQPVARKSLLLYAVQCREYHLAFLWNGTRMGMPCGTWINFDHNIWRDSEVRDADCVLGTKIRIFFRDTTLGYTANPIKEIRALGIVRVAKKQCIIAFKQRYLQIPYCGQWRQTTNTELS